MIDDESRELFLSQANALSGIEHLVGVDDSFKDTVRFVAHRVLANEKVHLFLYQVSQLSELGTGFGGSFGNGGTQSDRRDDVQLSFITGICGIPCTIRLRGDEITIRATNGFRKDTLPNIADSRRAALASTLDHLVNCWWNGMLDTPEKIGGPRR